MIGGYDVQIILKNGRFYLHCPEEHKPFAEDALNRLFGIAAFAETKIYPKILEDIIAASIEEGKKLRKHGINSFKIETRRTDKSFPYDSYRLCCLCGKAILDAVPGLAVNVRNPDAVIQIEIREKAYIYSFEKKALGGLPVGTSGRGLLLLSGGIDSPVAGFFMASRGMGIDAVHFHAYPYTSEEAKQKVIRLAAVLERYAPGIRLYIIGFTKIQMKIKDAPLPWSTILLRMAMMDCAEKIALKIKSKCLITGESLSQVASQTIENLSCTQSIVTLPVLRPLIGMGKNEIIRKAEQIKTYSISIEPHEDCCILFTPPHPILHGNIQEAKALYHALELDSFIEDAILNCEKVKY